MCYLLKSLLSLMGGKKKDRSLNAIVCFLLNVDASFTILGCCLHAIIYMCALMVRKNEQLLCRFNQIKGSLCESRISKKHIGMKDSSSCLVFYSIINISYFFSYPKFAFSKAIFFTANCGNYYLTTFFQLSAAFKDAE